MNIADITWHRLFSQSLYKNKTIPMGQLSCIRYFVSCTRGDLHPVIQKSEDFREFVADSRYHLQLGSIQRLLGQYFPYATYEITFCASQGSDYNWSYGNIYCFEAIL